MADLSLSENSFRKNWSRRRDTAAVRDLVLGVAGFSILLCGFVLTDAVERLSEIAREYEAWELDEVLALVPALTLVLAWYAARRWWEARRLNVALGNANEVLKNTHAQRLAAAAQLRDAQRLESLGRLAGGLAHELNNMLQPILTLTQLSLKEPSLTDDTRSNLEKILEASDYSHDIVCKVLTFARGQSQEREEVIFAACLEKIVEFSRTVLPPGIDVECEIEPLPQTVVINRTELTQVITNLFMNAARAIDSRGTLKVALRLETLSGQEAVGPSPAGGHFFKLQVSDNGRGMPKEVQMRAFDPFFTTGQAGASVGLGLAVVHGIINEWGGRISVRSTPGKGTCFTILVPAVDPDMGLILQGE